MNCNSVLQLCPAGRDATGVARGGWRREQEAEKTALTEAMESQAGEHCSVHNSLYTMP